MRARFKRPRSASTFEVSQAEEPSASNHLQPLHFCADRSMARPLEVGEAENATDDIGYLHRRRRPCSA